ncbi:MSMEG_0567/Sll0786 family nitrogen starvation N-acetyltransferase [Aquabacterium sp. UBA2148]|uniref:MSMEG_0567/Sll0786 family nitrogen starvation N-acetyltransferase n=1 Tax=Aquabacterium sp. UBA2148 TaxID=1946042 RepID=UPI00257ACA8E|nr:MSMEG_0567/Sll0786 family nitrogen starvation N-acetyltransferase [Aquabacterium sp. UBA2148]
MSHVTLDVLCDLPQAFQPAAFRIKRASEAWERRDAHALRRAVFCVEQGIFVGDDRDANDAAAQLLVACTSLAGECDQVVGTVRIHEAEPGVWWGSRLAVHPSFRHMGRIGATLIQLAVCSARAQGAHTFLAHVQQANVPLFERLHWHSLAGVSLHGRPHALMHADLLEHPPCHAPDWGFLTQTTPRAGTPAKASA